MNTSIHDFCLLSKAHVRYIDYGNEETTDASQMVKLTGELSTLKPHAIRLHMYGLKPTCTQKTNAEEHKRVGVVYHKGLL